MNVSVLQIYLHKLPLGKLFKFFNNTAEPVIRFVADESFIDLKSPPMVSLSLVAGDPQQQRAFWHDVIRQPAFNGAGGRLPVFFQNMLPEGVFRRHLAQDRGCKEDDHFELLAASGLDLPGAVRALPVSLDRDELSRLVTQDNDALAMSVTADPLPMGVSISGMQPKLGLIEEGGRYVARKRHGVTRIIGKLPQVDRELLPEVEFLSMQLAAAAGIKVCDIALEPLTKLNIEHGYTIGGSPNFLAVRRFDRDGPTRIHCEDFAQVLGVDPQNKYSGASYAAMAAMMMRYPSMGEPAVHQLLRQIVVNDLLGNYDAHLKNFCVIYPDGAAPVLAPAFDIVAWSVYLDGHGSALALYREEKPRDGHQPNRLSPSTLREFCARVGVPEKPCAAVIKDTVRLAASKWATMIDGSLLNERQRGKLHSRIGQHPFLQRIPRLADTPR